MTATLNAMLMTKEQIEDMKSAIDFICIDKVHKFYRYKEYLFAYEDKRSDTILVDEDENNLVIEFIKNHKKIKHISQNEIEKLFHEKYTI